MCPFRVVVSTACSVQGQEVISHCSWSCCLPGPGAKIQLRCRCYLWAGELWYLTVNCLASLHSSLSQFPYSTCAGLVAYVTMTVLSQKFPFHLSNFSWALSKFSRRLHLLWILLLYTEWGKSRFIYLSKFIYLITMEYYAAERKKGAYTLCNGMDGTGELSEISQAVRDKYHMISPLTGT